MLFSTYFRALSAGKKIALVAVFSALSIVVNVFSIDVGASNKIAFTYAVCFFAGCMLGGVPAFLVAFLGDTIGFFINAQGGVFWLFGVTLGIYALIMGAIMNVPFGKGRAAPYLKAVIAFAAGYLLITVGLNTVVNYWYARIFFWGGQPNKTIGVYLAGRIGFQSVVYAVNVGVSMVLLPVMLHIGRPKAKHKKYDTAPQNEEKV